ncbi:TetR/AcrR family transcriptional regulator [Anoxynatronum sibiricum]|uniref:TetR/AcrR family transcriptional regulator n=1 Tax=Anoxynatronum sibiricum TaxID=210623 RepID=A0ABU9VT83_9CLOT
MPKHFQAKEKEMIYDRLIEEGKKSWGLYGIKRTNIDEICNAVGISKGSFYSFFHSKELFFMEIREKSEQEIKELLMEVTFNHQGSSKERFIAALSEVFQEVRRHPWLISLMKNRGEYEQLLRKLPQERVEKHIAEDQEDIEKLMMHLGLEAEDVNIKTVAVAIRGLFFLLLHEQELGKEHIESVINLLVEGLAERLFGRV